jgi:septal ring factor EnvC (AmiA/AmiB activator)
MAPKHHHRREVAEASIALANELPVRHANASRSNMLIDTAKRLQRLQTRRAKLRKELKTIDADIRHAKRELRALAQVIGRGE